MHPDRPTTELETFRWLREPAGRELLARATESVAEHPDDPMRVGEALRAHAESGHVAAALTQVELRAHATAKFGERASRMFFTREGLEQATRWSVAAHRAGRLRAAGLDTLIDLGCGIGGDLLAAASAGLTVAGVDLDPVRVAVAEANLAALDLGGAVTVADVTTVDHSGFDVAYADPARRTGSGRSFRASDWRPPWAFVESLLVRPACVKAAPGIPHGLVPDGVEAEWVSDHGEVKEAALWSGWLATCTRRATVIGHGGLATLTDEDAVEPDTGPVAEFLYEPDGAVIRAGLVTAVAAGVGGHLLDRRIAYVASADPFRTPFARSYRVVEELPYREKALRAALRERGIGRLTIKKRGVGIVPEQLRRRLALKGDAEATIVLTRVAGAGTCLRVEPL